MSGLAAHPTLSTENQSFKKNNPFFKPWSKVAIHQDGLMISFHLLKGSAFVSEIEPMGLGYPEDTLKVLCIPTPGGMGICSSNDAFETVCRMFRGYGLRTWRFFRGWVEGRFSSWISLIPYFRFIRETADSQVPITFRMWWQQIVLGRHDGVYWPVHPTSVINVFQNILIGVHTSPGYAPGCYIQGIGRVYIGDYTQIAQNVGIISANHDMHDSSKYHVKEVRIGSYCWIGMNAVILPGVELGDFTVVGAGAVVTKSFPEGHCVIAGNPARVIRRLDPGQCVRYTYRHEYVGFFRRENFEKYRRQNLRI